MKIEVFKEFKDNVRLFDAIDPTYITWLFNSENRRDGESSPPYENPYDYYADPVSAGGPTENGYENSLAPGEQSPDTIYFDNDEYYTKFITTQKNVVLDFVKPKLVSWSGHFTAFKTPDEHGGSGRHDYAPADKWTAELIIKDDSGIDDGAYTFSINGSEVLTSTRKDSNPPEYEPVKTPERVDGVKIKVQRSDVDRSMHRVTIEMDPEKLEAYLLSCNEDDKFKYLLIDFTIFDIAGNAMETPDEFKRQAFVYFDVSKDELLEDVRKLNLAFIDTYPSNLFIDEDMIGRTTISVTDPNETLNGYGFTPKIGLLSDSVGFLSGDTIKDDDGAHQLVDGISSAGYVKAYAYLDGSLGEVECKIGDIDITMVLDDDLVADIRSLTYVEGVLGPFIVECTTNTRKIDVDPFVPGVLKEEGFYGLCKHLERFLNTMYTPMGADCRIGILEKTDRISHFKDPDSCEPELLTKFAEEHGSEFDFTRAQIQKAADVIIAHAKTPLDARDLIESIYRRYYQLLPYINRWKGTIRSFELLYRVLGIDVTIYQLWEGPNHDLVREDAAGEDYDLTAHIELELKSSEYTQKEMRDLSDFLLSAVKSILPVNRVISDIVTKDTFTTDTVNIRINIAHDDREFKPTKPEKIYFYWMTNGSRFQTAVEKQDHYLLQIPAYSTGAVVGHSIDKTLSWPIPQNAAFYFKRYENMAKTYDNSRLILNFCSKNSANMPVNQLTTITLDIKSVNFGHDQIKIKLKKTEENSNQINKYNANILDPNKMLVAAFKFSRAVENYCEPIPFREYAALEALDDPFDED